MTLRRSFTAFVTASVALSAGCSARPYLPMSSVPFSQGPVATAPTAVSLMSSDSDLELDALERKQSGQNGGGGHGPGPSVFTTITGTVTKLLPDDTHGLTHQLFIFNVNGKQVRVAHNTDLAPHVPVHVGDTVTCKGEYIKAKPNDVIHWTHYNPQGGEGGYIELNGKKYDRL